ncbi:MAG: DUF4105 domain-containing protein [Bacteroidaceae bacterium]|nr:DUF4105 domain-containing protein [Bacteroidaceae bacterium]
MTISAQERNDSISSSSADADQIKVSLVTCSPGQLVYELFGHTAIRVEDPKRHQDLVFNYGVFNFNTDNFVYRFVKGETDYELGVVEWKYFIQEYAKRGSSIDIQEIDLTEDEKVEVVNYLLNNYEPRNRTYRYNYFYDNCTTRARDVIEESVAGQVVYIPVNNNLTFRDIVHQFTDEHPWSELGIDFCLGAEADRPIDQRLQMFVPSYTEKMFTSAIIKDIDGNNRRMVRKAFQALPVGHQPKSEEFPLSPMTVFWTLFVISVGIVLLEQKFRKIFWGVDIIVGVLHGLGGVVVAFLFFFSVHPTVGSNWLVLVFNPLWLIWLPFSVVWTIHHRSDRIHIINVLVLLVFLASMPFIPQVFNECIYPILLTFCLRSVSHLLWQYHPSSLVQRLSFRRRKHS